MLRKFAAVMLATTLIAGTAFAAQPSATAGSTPAAPAAAAAAAGTTGANAATVKQTTAAKPTKMVKHSRQHARKHFARGKSGKIKVTQHVKASKSHRGHVARITKPGKVTKSNKAAV